MHHLYTSELCSFTITNVHDLQATLTINDAQTGELTSMTFEHDILTAVQPETTEHLFVSIEPMKTTTTEGCYLLPPFDNLCPSRGRLEVY
jgi:hypothetical protein